jgi:hypothetical protein
MAPWIWQLISPSLPDMKVRDVRRSMMDWMMKMTRTVAAQAAADIADDVQSRDPQQHDPAAQQIGSRAVNALHTHFNPGQEQGQEASASSASRSARPRGIHEQEQLNSEEMASIYGIGSRLVMSMGWQPNTRLGKRRNSSAGLDAALTNDWNTRDRPGVGFSLQQDDDTTIQSGVLVAFPNPALEPAVNRELCCVCMEEIGRRAIVEYRCTHSLHAECDNALVAAAVERGFDEGHAKCPMCRAPREVMENTPNAETENIGAPTFQREVADGSPVEWHKLQMHSRLPSFAVARNPDLAAIAEPWTRQFLRLRPFNDTVTLEDAFESFTADNDVMGGVMVAAVLKASWKHHSPQGQVAYHGTHLAAIYSILYWGLTPGPAENRASNGDIVRGVFVHKHGTKHKARNYMAYVMFPGGFMVGVLLKCTVAGPPIRRTCPPDQWCVVSNEGVQTDVVYFHFIKFEDVQPGEFWTWGNWDPKIEANPSNSEMVSRVWPESELWEMGGASQSGS